MKSEGLIPPNELSREPGTNAEDVVKVGEQIDVYVMDVGRSGRQPDPLQEAGGLREGVGPRDRGAAGRAHASTPW